MPVKTLGVDIGLHGLGCGYFLGGVLVAGFYVPAPGGGPPFARGPGAWGALARELAGYPITVDVLVMETMQVYVHGQRKADDLLELQGIAGALCGVYPDAKMVGYLPRVWKGNTKPAILAERVFTRLGHRGGTGVILPHPKRRFEDVMHGVGVGMYRLGLLR